MKLLSFIFAVSITSISASEESPARSFFYKGEDYKKLVEEINKKTQEQERIEATLAPIAQEFEKCAADCLKIAELKAEIKKMSAEKQSERKDVLIAQLLDTPKTDELLLKDCREKFWNSVYENRDNLLPVVKEQDKVIQLLKMFGGGSENARLFYAEQREKRRNYALDSFITCKKDATAAKNEAWLKKCDADLLFRVQAILNNPNSHKSQDNPKYKPTQLDPKN